MSTYQLLFPTKAIRRYLSYGVPGRPYPDSIQSWQRVGIWVRAKKVDLYWYILSRLVDKGDIPPIYCDTLKRKNAVFKSNQRLIIIPYSDGNTVGDVLRGCALAQKGFGNLKYHIHHQITTSRTKNANERMNAPLDFPIPNIDSDISWHCCCLEVTVEVEPLKRPNDIRNR